MSEPGRSLQVHRPRGAASEAARVDRVRHTAPAEVIDLTTFRRARRAREEPAPGLGPWLWVVLVLGLLLGVAAMGPGERTMGQAVPGDWPGD
jgi:hypothetical protein